MFAMSKEAVLRKGAPLLATLRLDLEAVESGLPVSTLTKFLSASGMQCRDIYKVVISARTLKQRIKRREPLTMDEADRLLRLIRVYDETAHVFGNRKKALSWLTQPKLRFNERTPLQMLRTDLGGRMVEEMLVQIDEGMFT
jgi:putative toxin-antitoxin system antitoxin component (TIGR02293 family)